MDGKDYRTLLAFSDQWFLLGILTDGDLLRLGATYEAGDDKNTEHFRYGVFQQHLKEHWPLSSAMAEALYKLGASDPDGMMGGAMMADILGLPECPTSVLEKGLTSGQKHLIVLVERQRLLSELQQVPLPAETFSRCVRSSDSIVHRALLKRGNLSREQLQRLADQGANRAVRNMAVVELRRTKT